MKHCIHSTIVLALLTLCLPISAREINSRVGTSAFPFLKINVSARAVGMGGAFTGLADDASALYYNPAGIASYSDKQFVAGYHNYFVDIQSGFVAYTTPVTERLYIGAWASYLNYGEFIETNISGDIIDNFSGGDLMTAFTVALKHNRSFSYGGTVKAIYEKVHDFSASGIAVDLAVKYSSDRDRYSAGLMVQNLGRQLSALGTEKYRLPLMVRAGGAMRPRSIPVVVAADGIFMVDNNPVVALGIEYFEFQPFYARMGWNSFGSNYRGADSDDIWAGLSMGVGFDHNQLHIAYAYSPAADLGSSHRATVIWSK